MKDLSKRLFDIVASGPALLILSPLLLLITLWIHFDSPGPVIFRQRRIGKHQVTFNVLKFRTMIDRPADAINQHEEAVVTEGRDPRITRAGRFLRGTSLDELPQLWNILRGDMSIVGPRPILPEQLEVVPDEFACRFDVSPGLTGLAQVRGRRGLGWLQQLEADAEYTSRYALIYDIGIILRTIRVVMKGAGVYGGTAENWRAYRDRLHAEQGHRQPRGPRP